MRIETVTEIHAPVAVVWAILIDFAAYPEWNPLTVQVHGEPRFGEVVRLHVDMGGKPMVRKHEISRVDAEAALCWTIRTRRPWLMRGERCQTLEATGPDHTLYHNDERVEGLVGPLVQLTYGRKIRTALEAVGAALKERAENVANSAR